MLVRRAVFPSVARSLRLDSGLVYEPGRLHHVIAQKSGELLRRGACSELHGLPQESALIASAIVTSAQNGYNFPIDGETRFFNTIDSNRSLARSEKEGRP